MKKTNPRAKHPLSTKPKPKPTSARVKQAPTRKLLRSEILPDPDNPRVISPLNRERLSKSLLEDGLIGTLVWNSQTGNLVGGHQRLDLMDQLNNAFDSQGNLLLDYEVEVSVIDVNTTRQKQINILLNNQNLHGEWDPDLLIANMEDILQSSPEDQNPLAPTGFDIGSISEVLMDLGAEIPPSLSGEPDASDILDFISDDLDDAHQLIEGQKQLERAQEASQELTDRLRASASGESAADLDARIKLNKQRFETKQAFSQAATSVSLVFGTDEQAEVFLHALGIEDQGYVDGLVFCEKLGMPLKDLIERFRVDDLPLGSYLICSPEEDAPPDLEDHAKRRLLPKHRVKKEKQV